MASLLTASKRLLVLGLFCILPSVAWAQAFAPQGAEYSLGALRGDQLFPNVSVNAAGGYAVWEDSVIDGKNYGIAALRLDSNFSPLFGAFRVNQGGIGVEEKPKVAVFKNGGAAIVWQGRPTKFASIYARFLKSNGTFTSTNDIRVNSTATTDQVTPALTVMTNGNLFVVWSSWNYSTATPLMQDIRAQILTTNGTKIGTNFFVNGTNASAPTELYNQRSPTVATLANGNIAVAWVSENQGLPGSQYLQGTNWIHIYARLYNPAGAPLGPEFRINTSLYTMCANPSICGLSDGGFTVVWSQRATVRNPDSWDVYTRSFAPNGAALADSVRLNSYTFGDQFGPTISRVGDTQLAVWTSLGQDGSWEGVYGQFLSGGNPLGAEFQVNTTTLSRQMHPIVTSDGVKFLVAWTSFVRDTSFDIYAQRYASGQSLPQPAAPFVAALSSYSLGATWPELSGFPLSHYEVYLDGSRTPTATTTNSMWLANGLAPGSTHWFQIAFVLAGGQRSPLSDPSTNQTWGIDLSGKFGTPDGLPDDWQRLYFGPKTGDWDGPNFDSDGDGASNWQEFLAGTNPRDPNSVLKTSMTSSPQGRRLSWNTVAGCVYQVQMTPDFQTWSDVGPPRLAAGTTDTVLAPGAQGVSYYRVVRVQ